MSVSEFFHMGGYAFYVWSSYGLALVVLGWIMISPVFSKKAIIKELKIKYRQQERQHQEDV